MLNYLALFIVSRARLIHQTTSNFPTLPSYSNGLSAKNLILMVGCFQYLSHWQTILLFASWLGLLFFKFQIQSEICTLHEVKDSRNDFMNYYIFCIFVLPRIYCILYFGMKYCDLKACIRMCYDLCKFCNINCTYIYMYNPLINMH